MLIALWRTLMLHVRTILVVLSQIACIVMKGIRFYLLVLKLFLVVLSELLFSAPPKLINVVMNQTVPEGADLQLFCEASGNPAPDITWTMVFRNGSDSEVLHRGLTWNMVNIKRANQGTYRCTAYNGAGNADSSVANINVTCKKKIQWCFAKLHALFYSMHKLQQFID